MLFLVVLLYGAQARAEDDMPRNLAGVTELLQQLKKDRSADIRERDGWTVITIGKQNNQVTWFFAPKDHVAYPAVIRKTKQKKGQGFEILTEMFCESSKRICDELLKPFIKKPGPVK